MKIHCESSVSSKESCQWQFMKFTDTHRPQSLTYPEQENRLKNCLICLRRKVLSKLAKEFICYFETLFNVEPDLFKMKKKMNPDGYQSRHQTCKRA